VEGTGVACMVAIDLLVLLAAGYSGLGSIDYYADVSVIVAVREVPWLVRTTNELRNEHCHATQRELGSIEKVDGLTLVAQRDVRTLGVVLGFQRSLTQSAIDQAVRDAWNAVANVGVERDSAVLFFRVELLNGCSLFVVSPFILGQILFFSSLEERAELALLMRHGRVKLRRRSLSVREVMDCEGWEPEEGLSCCQVMDGEGSACAIKT
jgi:hypothetical protein